LFLHPQRVRLIALPSEAAGAEDPVLRPTRPNWLQPHPVHGIAAGPKAREVHSREAFSDSLLAVCTLRLLHSCSKVCS